ncbi:transposase [Puniceicoccaceae bacterium K14]|nr:transposase [Puniceicoccaceae bacterium K14]
MAEKFVNVDRDTPMLLPPDLRDWVEKDDIAHFVLEVAYRVSPDSAHVNNRGSGLAQYPPSMMLALLLYCYSQGIYSSRKIEKATYSNISVRYLTGNCHPDHDTIASFRRRNKQFIKQAFVTTVKVGQEVGLSRLGTMAIDGTSLKASAGKKTTCFYGNLESLCNERMERAEQEERETQTSDKSINLPSKAKLTQALAKIDRGYEKRKRQREILRKEVKDGDVGSLPHQLPAKVPASKKVNTVDTDCHFMPMKEGFYSLGYNAQLAVDTGSLLITAALISTSSNDSHQLLRVAQESHRNCEGMVETVVADSGYDNNHQINELEKKCGIHAVVAVKDPHRLSIKHKQSKRRQRTRALKIKRIEELETKKGKGLLKQRNASVETVFGIIKHAMQFRAFLQRGRENVDAEWKLISAAFNLKRLASLMAASR